MLEFKVIENLKANKDLTDILKKFKYKVKLGQTKTILHTNLQVVILLNTRLHILLLLQYLNTKLMNNYKNMAEEIVLNEYVFV